MSTVGPEMCHVLTGDVHVGGSWDGHPEICGARAAGSDPFSLPRWVPACRAHRGVALLMIWLAGGQS